MADPTAGLLDPAMLAQLQALVEQFNKPSPEMLAQANRDKWMATGLGILGAGPGNVWQNLGRGGLLGMQAGQQSLHDQLAARQAGLAQATGALGLANALNAYQEDAITRKVLADRAAQAGLPNSPASIGAAPSAAGGTPPASQSGFIPGIPVAGPDWIRKDIEGIPYAVPPPGGSASPAPSGGGPVTPSGQPVPAKTSLYQQYKDIGDALAARGATKNAQSYYDLAEKFRPKLKETKTLTQNGQRVTVNFYDDGSTEVLPLGPDKEKAHFLDTGTQVGAVDPFTGQPVPGGGLYNKQMTPGETASNTLGYANLAETKRYHNLELGIGENGEQTNVEGVAKAIANYDQAPLSAWAMSKPIGAAIMSRVMEINPTYDAKNYATAQQTMNAFGKGPEARTTRSIGVAMQHLDVLQQAGNALANGDIQLFNRIGNAFQAQTGGAAPTNFNAVKDLVANEITKAITGTGGGVTDRDKAQKTVDAANSPQQLAAVIDSYKQLFAGQLAGLEQQYKAGTQRSDFQQRFLNEQTRALMHGGAGASRPIYVDKNGNRAYRNPDGSYTEIK